MLSEPDLSFIKPDINLDEVAPLPRRRVIAFVNCFIGRLTDQLQHIAETTEEAILRAEEQLDHTERKLALLEAKMAHIPLPSVNGVREEKEKEKPVEIGSMGGGEGGVEVARPDRLEQEQEAPSTPVSRAAPVPLPATPSTLTLTVKDDPVYSKYFKMLRLGVVDQAVRLKMQSEGVDPKYLDTPDAPSPSVSGVPLDALSPSTALTHEGREEEEGREVDVTSIPPESDSDSVASFTDSE